MVATDVTQEDSVRAAIDAALRHYGGLHIVHNNAGGSTPVDSTVVEVPIEEFWRAIRLDLFGTLMAKMVHTRLDLHAVRPVIASPMMLCRLLFPLMRSIVNPRIPNSSASSTCQKSRAAVWTGLSTGEKVRGPSL